MADAWSMWKIYDHPSDFPDCFVARRFTVTPNGTLATGDVISGTTLRTVRAEMTAMHLTCLHRSRDDDPVIVETWL